MSRKKPTPNYQLMFESAVYSLQMAFNDYKKAYNDVMRWTFITNDGYIGVLSGYEERQMKQKEAEQEVIRLMSVVKELRERIEP